jgi:hypothetical protein
VRETAGVRGHRPERARFGPQHGDISETIAADGQPEREIQQYPLLRDAFDAPIFVNFRGVGLADGLRPASFGRAGARESA